MHEGKLLENDEEAGVLFFSFATYVLVLVFFSLLFC